jgi:uncharacterized phage-associated protein
MFSQKEKEMLSCHDVAKYFLSLEDENAGDLISNLKLQKLVYYAQGFHLALYDEHLFPEHIEAWTHGPVVPSLYHQYKEYGAGPIPKPENIDFELFDPRVRELLDEVHAVFGQFSAWKPRNMTHEEPPWRDVADNAGLITQRAMKDYFKTLLENGEV